MEGSDFEVIETVAHRWDQFSKATDPLTQGIALIKLNDAIADLKTWHPNFNLDTGEIEGMYDE